MKRRSEGTLIVLLGSDLSSASNWACALSQVLHGLGVEFRRLGGRGKGAVGSPAVAQAAPESPTGQRPAPHAHGLYTVEEVKAAAC